MPFQNDMDHSQISIHIHVSDVFLILCFQSAKVA